MFTFYTDPGHGWLEVSLSDIENLGLSPRDFSRYSYRNDNAFYLEEDCDAPRFLNAWKNKNGIEPRLKEVHQAETFIRDLPRISKA